MPDHQSLGEPEDELSHEALVELESVLYSQLHHISSHSADDVQSPAPLTASHTLGQSSASVSSSSSRNNHNPLLTDGISMVRQYSAAAADAAAAAVSVPSAHTPLSRTASRPANSTSLDNRNKRYWSQHTVTDKCTKDRSSTNGEVCSGRTAKKTAAGVQRCRARTDNIDSNPVLAVGAAHSGAKSAMPSSQVGRAMTNGGGGRRGGGSSASLADCCDSLESDEDVIDLLVSEESDDSPKRCDSESASKRHTTGQRLSDTKDRSDVVDLDVDSSDDSRSASSVSVVEVVSRTAVRETVSIEYCNHNGTASRRSRDAISTTSGSSSRNSTGRAYKRHHATIDLDSTDSTSSSSVDIVKRGDKRRRPSEDRLQINISTAVHARAHSPASAAGATASEQLQQPVAARPLFHQMLANQPRAARCAGADFCSLQTLTRSPVASSWSREQIRHYQQCRVVSLDPSLPSTVPTTPRASGRYYNSHHQRRRHSLDAINRCRRCDDAEHAASACPRPPVCHLCGVPGHAASDGCPDVFCYRCGSGDHALWQCRGAARRAAATATQCRLCHVHSGHETRHCPDQWRRYHCTTTPHAAPQRPPFEEGHQHRHRRQAGGGVWCCSCGRRGHRYHECGGQSGAASASSVSQQVIAYTDSQSPQHTAHWHIDSKAVFERLFGGSGGGGDQDRGGGAGGGGGGARQRCLVALQKRTGARLLHQMIGSRWLVTAAADSQATARSAVKQLRSFCFSPGQSAISRSLPQPPPTPLTPYTVAHSSQLRRNAPNRKQKFRHHDRHRQEFATNTVKKIKKRKRHLV